MRVIFLDFDGVLIPITAQYLKKRPAVICEPAMAQLNRIVEETGAEVVVSSSWRKLHSVERLGKLLEYWGFKGKVRDKTPNMDKRGLEIKSWLRHQEVRNNLVESFVILDDEVSDMAPMTPFVIKTEGQSGLIEENATEAIGILHGNRRPTT